MSFIGRQAGVGWAKEASRGTAEASADVFIPYTSISANDVPDKVVDEASVGVLANAVGDAVVTKKSEISIEGKVEVVSAGDLMLQALGQVSSQAQGDGTYKHTFSFANNSQHPSYTIFKYDPVASFRYALAMMSKLELNLQLGQYFLFTAEYTAKSGESVLVTPSYASNQYNFLPQHASVRFADTISGLDTAQAICTRVASISIDKGVITDQCLGSQDYNDILNGQIQISGSLELVFNTDQYRQWMMSDAKKAMRLEVKDSGTTIGTVNANPSITIDLYNVKIQATPVSYEQSELATVTVDFNAYYSVVDAEIAKATIINTKANY